MKMAWALNFCLDVELLAPGMIIGILFCVCVLIMLYFIILGSMDIGREVNKKCCSVDPAEKLMVYDMNEPRGVILVLEELCCPCRMLPFTKHSVPQGSNTLSGICAARAIMLHGS